MIGIDLTMITRYGECFSENILDCHQNWYTWVPAISDWRLDANITISKCINPNLTTTFEPTPLPTPVPTTIPTIVPTTVPITTTTDGPSNNDKQQGNNGKYSTLLTDESNCVLTTCFVLWFQSACVESKNTIQFLAFFFFVLVCFD